MDKDKISKYRSEVIESFINVEWIINAIISQHYIKRVEQSFLFEVLYDEYFTFALRRRILEKIIKNNDKLDKQKVQDLNRLNTIRNYFAHCSQEFIFLSEKPPRWKVVDPRNIKNEVDFEGLYVDFMKRVIGIEKYLAKLLYDLGGKLVRDLPKA